MFSKNVVSKGMSDFQLRIVTYETEGRQISELFNWIIVCSGHHNLPHIPDIPGNPNGNELL